MRRTLGHVDRTLCALCTVLVQDSIEDEDLASKHLFTWPVVGAKSRMTQGARIDIIIHSPACARPFPTQQGQLKMMNRGWHAHMRLCWKLAVVHLRIIEGYRMLALRKCAASTKLDDQLRYAPYLKHKRHRYARTVESTSRTPSPSRYLVQTQARTLPSSRRTVRLHLRRFLMSCKYLLLVFLLVSVP